MKHTKRASYRGKRFSVYLCKYPILSMLFVISTDDTYVNEYENLHQWVIKSCSCSIYYFLLLKFLWRVIIHTYMYVLPPPPLKKYFKLLPFIPYILEYFIKLFLVHCNWKILNFMQFSLQCSLKKSCDSCKYLRIRI